MQVFIVLGGDTLTALINASNEYHILEAHRHYVTAIGTRVVLLLVYMHNIQVVLLDETKRVASKSHQWVTSISSGTAVLVKREIIYELELCTFENTRSIEVCLHTVCREIRRFTTYRLDGTCFIFRLLGTIVTIPLP